MKTPVRHNSFTVNYKVETLDCVRALTCINKNLRTVDPGSRFKLRIIFIISVPGSNLCGVSIILIMVAYGLQENSGAIPLGSHLIKGYITYTQRQKCAKNQ
jgi:hypothetical protein